MNRILPSWPFAFVLMSAWTPAQAGTAGNADTGVRASQCYVSGQSALTDCAASDLAGQDGQLGRDATAETRRDDDGTLGFSFTRICNSGEAAGTGTCPAEPVLGPGADDWACVRDDVTDVLWEVKTAVGARAAWKTYTNYSADDDPAGEWGSSTDATGYVRSVNDARLCGYDDWGLGHTDKVLTIVDFGVDLVGAARVDGRFFPTLAATWYWNASPNPSSPGTAFSVNFADGSVSNAADRGTRRRVQVLRNGKTRFGANGRYELSADGAEVRDTTEGAVLTWRRCVEGMHWDGSTCAGEALRFTHEEALRQATAQARATGLAWRVPSVKEQNGLVQRQIATPTIVHPVFPRTPAGPSWTSTPETRHPTEAWAVDFGVGLVASHPRSAKLPLRLARDSDGDAH